PEPLLARAELELAALRRTSRSGEPSDAIRIARRSLERYRKLGDRFGQVAALNMIGVLQRAQGALADANQAFEDALALSSTLGHPWWESLILCNLGATALWRGETREARLRLEEAVRGFRALDDGRGTAFTLHLLALVRCAQGDARTAAALAIEGLDAARRAEAMETTIDLIAAAGVIASAGGEFAPAITLLEAADLLSSRAMYRIERPERDVYEDAERIARRALGLSQAERHLREVDRLSLDAAVDVARSVLARIATHSAPTPGIPAPEGADLAIHDLTVREHQVLALMAQRYTDREIADTLDISVRTVSRHVSNIFAKLGLRSRRDVLSRVPVPPESPA
ncbi:MAG: LuxR C-terminal-related transcriptional regulator, partial [Thermomicrobiales bacterium]